MTIEKKRKLRRLEFTFTDGEVHPVCHCAYEDCVVEDGVELMKKNHREVEDTDKYIDHLKNSKKHKHPEIA